MIKPPILAALNKRILHEQSNAHAYHAVSLYFGRLNLHGLEAFIARQVEEERAHADKFIQHVTDRGGDVKPKVAAAYARNFETHLGHSKACKS
jgi:ferritin